MEINKILNYGVNKTHPDSSTDESSLSFQREAEEGEFKSDKR